MNPKPVIRRERRHIKVRQITKHAKEFSNILASSKIPLESSAESLPGTDFSADTWPVQSPDHHCSLRWLPASSVFPAESCAQNEKTYLAWQGLLSCKELTFVKGLPHFLLSKSLVVWKNSFYMDFRLAELVKSLGWVHKWWGVSGYKCSLRKTVRHEFCVSGL